MNLKQELEHGEGTRLEHEIASECAKHAQESVCYLCGWPARVEHFTSRRDGQAFASTLLRCQRPPGKPPWGFPKAPAPPKCAPFRSDVPVDPGLEAELPEPEPIIGDAGLADQVADEIPADLVEVLPQDGAEVQSAGRPAHVTQTEDEERRPRPRPELKERDCEKCGQKFTMRSTTHRFCDECKRPTNSVDLVGDALRALRRLPASAQEETALREEQLRASLTEV